MFEFTERQRLAALALLFFSLLGGSLLFFNRDNQGYIEEYRVNAEDDLIWVHVCGAVAKPGVISVKPGTRKHEVLRKAGGALPEGDLNQLNLAEYVLDGEQVYLPKKGETPLKSTRKKVSATTRNSSFGKQEKTKNVPQSPYDLNSATQKELESIPGIGPSLAERILQYRVKQGRFNSYEDLQKVNGIGAAKLEQLRAYLIVK